jgi:hypothetical protein
LIYTRLIALYRALNRVNDLHLRDIIIEADESYHQISAILIVGVPGSIPDLDFLSVQGAGPHDGIHDLVSVVGGEQVISSVPLGAIFVERALDSERATHRKV